VRGRDKRAGTRKKYFVYTKEKKEEKGRRKKQNKQLLDQVIFM
jgi:hypothetical protein